ncbi:hypothetical protein BD626DRAFT_239287 [Schizophyllum amplum]|uniref:Uncharacterized protein n=1 Tax=Schizophyllum amplum TaxID=97359 RepID=A0A550CJS8_9AGAR|nr:hypothetical protein BD626DRAFT_239287 [Auriculariopsis ampla]
MKYTLPLLFLAHSAGAKLYPDLTPRPPADLTIEMTSAEPSPPIFVSEGPSSGILRLSGPLGPTAWSLDRRAPLVNAESSKEPRSQEYYAYHNSVLSLVLDLTFLQTLLPSTCQNL